MYPTASSGFPNAENRQTNTILDLDGEIAVETAAAAEGQVYVDR